MKTEPRDGDDQVSQERPNRSDGNSRGQHRPFPWSPAAGWNL